MLSIDNKTVELGQKQNLMTQIRKDTQENNLIKGKVDHPVTQNKISSFVPRTQCQGILILWQ